MEKIKEKMLCNGVDCGLQKFYIDGNVPMGSYDGLSIQQHFRIVKSFYELIKKTNPKQIIEIGTAAGGLTLMIRDILDDLGLSNTELITYDPSTPQYLLERVKKDNIKITYKNNNLFNYEYNNLINSDEIKNLIQKEGVTIVLCDGGSKKNEFRLLSPFLKNNDIIMAHDYSPNETYFQEHINNKIWYWLEIQDSDINQSCVDNNLKPYMEDDFRQVVWVCKIKK